jgi:flagellar L-ring protein precursor FlgH
MKQASIAFVTALALAAPAWAQTTSIRDRYADQHAPEPRETPPVVGNPTLEGASIIAVRPPKPREFRVDDFITVIVREQRNYSADGTANARRQANLKSELDAFLKFTGGGVGAAAFRRGKPNIEYKGTFDQRNDAESEREERMTTRITAQIIDIKPNGNLVFEARKSIRHDDEISTMTLTGACRKVDITADNTVLSTQVADLTINVRNTGNVRNATRPGWLGTIYDWIRPL